MPKFPEFSASYSKAETLATCPRKYGIATYLSSGAGLPNAPPIARDAHRLKQLQTLHTVVGTAIHLEAKRFATAALEGADLPRYSDVLDRLEVAIAEATAQRDFDALGRGKEAPKLLRSLYYDFEIPAREIRLARQKAQAAAKHLVQSLLWAEIAAADDFVFELERLRKWRFDDVPIYVVTDLLGWGAAPGDIWLLDHKVSYSELVVTTQLAVYALYARSQGATHPERWRVELHNWVTGENRVVKMDNAALAAAENWLRRSIEKMRLYQSDPQRNVPVGIEHFEMAAAQQKNTCIHQCEYLELCVGRFDLKI